MTRRSAAVEGAGAQPQHVEFEPTARIQPISSRAPAPWNRSAFQLEYQNISLGNKLRAIHQPKTIMLQLTDDQLRSNRGAVVRIILALQNRVVRNDQPRPLRIAGLRVLMNPSFTYSRDVM